MNIDTIVNDSKDRSLTYNLSNTEVLVGKKAIHALYNTISTHDEFIELGDKKVIIVTGYTEGQEFNFHHNVLINSNTTFESYYNSVKDVIEDRYDILGNAAGEVTLFKVKGAP